MALLAGAALAVSACATSASGGGSASSHGSSGAASAPTNKAITWAYEQEFSQYNMNTPAGDTVANRVHLGPVLSGFWEFRPDGSLQPNTDFGTYVKVKDNPLTVKYSINPGAVWSDGKPIDCDDIVLAWLAHSGVTGATGFSAARTVGYDQQDRPACTAGSREVTVTYRTRFADWAAMYGPGEIMPAHIVEQRAGMTRTFVDYAATPTSPDLAKAVNFYDKGWALTPGQLRKDIIPSSGPYQLDAWTAGQSLTLKANPRWWGTPVKIPTIVIRYISGTAQAQALQNGEVQVMDPQPQTDIVNQLKAMGQAVTFTTGDQFTYEHLSFNFKGQFADASLREAFARCVPRQQIVDNLIKPQNARAQIMETRFVFPFQPGYAAFAAGLGGAQYDTVDLAGAKKLLAGRTPTVRIGWLKNPDKINKRRADTLALIQSSCGQAGFKVVDAGTPTFFEKEAPAGNFDVGMMAWVASQLVSDSAGAHMTGSGDNYGKYSDPQVDALFKRAMSETETAKQTALLKQIDTLLWKDLESIPLFTFPAIFALAKNTEGVVYNATVANLLWNVGSWNLA
ncbi:MAG TPA: ABC transporter family substrate-binding protein [Kineosporiaceae bacterium]